MQNKPAPRFLSADTMQDYLAIGYLYLLILGIVSDSIYYGMLGINILSYSNVLDVLLSPIVHLTENLVFPAIILLLPAIGFGIMKFIQKMNQKKATPSGKNHFLLSDENIFRGWVLFSAWLVFSAYLGYGLGGGQKLSQRMQSGDIQPDHRIFFHDREAQEVKVVGSNSTFIFYIEPGSKVVSISPMQENVWKLEALED